MSGLLGGWKIANLEACPLPEKLATGFSSAVLQLLGADYVPVLYCGSQLVSGTNYMLICKQTLATAEKQEHLVKMVLHEKLPASGEIVGEFMILSIETIV